MLLTSRPRVRVLFGFLVTLAVLPLALGGCDFLWSSHATVSVAPTATPRPTAGPFDCLNTTAPTKVSSDPYWRGSGENWHVEKWVIYSSTTGAFCGAKASASWILPAPRNSTPTPDLTNGGVMTPPPSLGQVCFWIEGQPKNCLDVSSPGNQSSTESDYVKPHYDSATGHMVDADPCRSAHMTFSLYPGIELAANQCDRNGHQ